MSAQADNAMRLLRASLLWFDELIEQTGIDPRETRYLVSIRHPDGSSRTVASISLAVHLEHLDDAISGEAGNT